MSNNTYFNTLSDAVDAALARAAFDKAVLKESPDITPASEVMTQESINYGYDRRWDFELETYKGRKTRKFFHVQIWRLSHSGTYELNTYVL
jgi:hypothetical protein